MADNLSRQGEHQLATQSTTAEWCHGWQLHVDCHECGYAKGGYRHVRDLVQRHPDDTLSQLAARARCQGCGDRPALVWLFRPAMRGWPADHIPLIEGVG